MNEAHILTISPPSPPRNLRLHRPLLLRTLRIERRHLNLHPHPVIAKTADLNAGPDRVIVGHLLLEVAYHGVLSLLVQLDVKRVDAEDVRPAALTPGVAERRVDVDEGLVDLLGDQLRDV